MLLEDGRFGFLMVKEDEDLRSVIDRNMKTNVGKSHGPFEKESEDAEMLMYRIALGMDWLHSHDIIHRDLKASNVLMVKGKMWMPFVVDFECSVGVVEWDFGGHLKYYKLARRRMYPRDQRYLQSKWTFIVTE
jgi:serine/threonine protein kinase